MKICFAYGCSDLSISNNDEIWFVNLGRRQISLSIDLSCQSA